MTSDKPTGTSEPAEPEVLEEPPPPPPPEPEPPPPAKAGGKAPEEVWMEDYDELIGPEEEPKPRKRKKRHWGSIIITVAVIVILLAWTLLSPEIMPQSGLTYVKDSGRYASAGNFTGSIDTWAGDVTWGLSMSYRVQAADRTSIEVDVLLTKVSENTSNWFVRGFSASLRNVSVFEDDGTFVASMSSSSDLGFGLMATIPVTLAAGDNYSLYVYAKFVVYGVMRIGYLPLKAVEIQAAHFDDDVVVD